MDKYIVYAQTDSSCNITAINSSAFITDITGWTQIDSGTGDKYHHAQGNYFSKSIMTEKGVYRYQWIDGATVEKTDAEIAVEEAKIVTPPTQTEILGQQVASLSLSGAQKDTLITQLGSQVVALQLAVAALKGGATS